MTKQERYEQLSSMPEGSQTDEESTEQIQLYYELNPNDQYWRDSMPDLTPRDHWGIDTSIYS